MASLAVSVITVTVLLSVIAHGASAEPLARRYGAAAGPGGNGDPGLPWAELSTHLSFPEIAGEMFLSRTTIKSQAIYRKLGGLLTQPGSRPVPCARAPAGMTTRSFIPPGRWNPPRHEVNWYPTASGGTRTRARA